MVQIGNEPAHSGAEKSSEQPVEKALGGQGVALAARQERGEGHQCAQKKNERDGATEH